MKTVLFLTQTVAPVGGVQRWLDQLSAGLPEHGWRVLAGLAWGRHHDPASFERAHPDLETLRLDGRSGTRAGRLLAIERAMRRTRPAVVVPVTLADPFEALREAKSSGQDVRLMVGAFEVSAAMLLDVRRYAPIVDQALGTSRLTSRLLHALAGLASERVAYVPPGYASAPPATRAAAVGPLRLGLVGRLDPDKRPLDLVELLRALDARGLDYRVRVVGDGALRAELDARCAAWRHGGRLSLEAPLPAHVLEREVWPALDVCLLFSPAEGGLPNVLAEAMLQGVAVVCADFRGRALQGLVRHDATGLVFPVGDMESAAACVARLARDAALRSRLADAGRALVASEYSLGAMLSGWRRALDAAVAGPAARDALPPLVTGERDRLAAWLGRRTGERARRWLRRGFRHTDAAEWPHHFPHAPSETQALEERIRAVAQSEACA